MARQERPLSPFLIYRWQITNSLSIVHRLTGVMLSIGAVLLTAWLVAIAGGPASYRVLAYWLGTPPGMLLLLGLTFCFLYHLCNGIRHLAWDAGYGFELRSARASGVAVVIAAATLTVAFWLVVLTGGGT